MLSAINLALNKNGLNEYGYLAEKPKFYLVFLLPHNVLLHRF